MQSPQPPERPFSGSVSFVVLPVRTAADAAFTPTVVRHTVRMST